MARVGDVCNIRYSTATLELVNQNDQESSNLLEHTHVCGVCLGELHNNQMSKLANGQNENYE